MYKPTDEECLFITIQRRWFKIGNRYDFIKTGNCLNRLESVKKKSIRAELIDVILWHTITQLYIFNRFFLYDLLSVSFSWFNQIIPVAVHIR